VSERHIGVDEAGRGPAIGPLVVCALSIPKEDRGILNNIGVDDSKNLSKIRRESIHAEIVSISKLRGWEIGLIHCDAGKIDRWMEFGTLNTLEVMLFAEAITKATEITSKFTLFLDACDVDAERFGRNVSSALGKRSNGFKIISKHRMDSTDAITGAASIIAKVNRDLAIDKLSKELGVDLGSGYPSDMKSKTAIEDLCREEIPNDCLRRKWSNVERAWMMHHRKPIPPREFGKFRRAQSALDEWN
jgi:ribonuclease HII